jgi:hypothetical protein
MRKVFLAGMFLIASVVGAPSCADEQSSDDPDSTLSADLGELEVEPTPAATSSTLDDIDVNALGVEPAESAEGTEPSLQYHDNYCERRCDCHCRCRHGHCRYDCDRHGHNCRQCDGRRCHRDRDDRDDHADDGDDDN